MQYLRMETNRYKVSFSRLVLNSIQLLIMKTKLFRLNFTVFQNLEQKDFLKSTLLMMIFHRQSFQVSSAFKNLIFTKFIKRLRK